MCDFTEFNFDSYFFIIIFHSLSLLIFFLLSVYFFVSLNDVDFCLSIFFFSILRPFCLFLPLLIYVCCFIDGTFVSINKLITFHVYILLLHPICVYFSMLFYEWEIVILFFLPVSVLFLSFYVNVFLSVSVFFYLSLSLLFRV